MISIFSKLSSLFFCIILGFYCSRKDFTDEKFDKDISNLIIKIILPCSIIVSMQQEFTKELFTNSIIVIASSILIHMFCIGIGFLYCKLSRTNEKDQGILVFAMTFTNVSYIGFPVLKAMYGEKAVFYAALVTMVFNLFVFTVGYVIISLGYGDYYKDKISFSKIFKNNAILAVIAGFMFFILQVKLPGFIYDSLNLVGGMTTPLALILIGSILQKSEFAQIFKNKDMLVVSLIRLVLIPLIIYFLFGLFIKDRLVLNILVVIFGMPVATITAILAKEVASNYILASQYVFVTTLFSVFSLPLLFYLLPR